MITIAVSRKCIFAVVFGLCLTVGYNFWSWHNLLHPRPQQVRKVQPAHRVYPMTINQLWIADQPPADAEPEPVQRIERLRTSGEVLFEKGRYNEAIATFQTARKQSQFDVQIALDLGKAYVSNGNYELAIDVLAPIRCQYSDYFSNSQPVDHALRMPKYPFKLLSGRLAQNIDYNARKSLETSVLAIYSQQTPLPSVNPIYKNKPQYQLLAACLAVGQKYHKQRDYDGSAAIYQLAGENSLGLPPSVVNNLIATGTVNERWHKLGNLWMNGLTKEERNFYFECLQNETARLSVNDIKVAAVTHLAATQTTPPEQLTKVFEIALEKCLKAYGKNTPEAANCMFDVGVALQFDCRFNDAKEMFKKTLSEYIREKAISEVGETHFNLALAHYGLGERRDAKKEFAAASDSFRSVGDFEGCSDADAARALLAVEYSTDAEDEQFLLRRFKSSTGDAITTAQLGLYYFKRGDLAKAEDPLQKAASIYYPFPANAPSLEGSTNGTIGGSDAIYTEKEILHRFFNHYARCSYRLASRYSDSAERFSCRTQLSENYALTSGEPLTYKSVVHLLYPQILRKQGKVAELARFEKRCQLLKPDFQLSETQNYLDVLGQHIADSWFCPDHGQVQEAICRLDIDKDGRIQAVALDKNDLSSEFNEAILDTAQFTFALPKPPIDWTGGQLVVKFNGDIVQPNYEPPSESAPNKVITPRRYY